MIKKSYDKQQVITVEAVLKNFSDGNFSIAIENLKGVESE